MKNGRLFSWIALATLFGMAWLSSMRIDETKAKVLQSDSNNDGVVDLKDFSILGQEWLQTGDIASYSKVSAGFYTGTGWSESEEIAVQHHLGVRPDVIVIVPLNCKGEVSTGDSNNNYHFPFIIVDHPIDGTVRVKALSSEASFKKFSNTVTDTFFIAGNDTPAHAYWRNRSGQVYMYLAVKLKGGVQ